MYEDMYEHIEKKSMLAEFLPGDSSVTKPLIVTGALGRCNYQDAKPKLIQLLETKSVDNKKSQTRTLLTGRAIKFEKFENDIAASFKAHFQAMVKGNSKNAEPKFTNNNINTSDIITKKNCPGEASPENNSPCTKSSPETIYSIPNFLVLRPFFKNLMLMDLLNYRIFVVHDGTPSPNRAQFRFRQRPFQGVDSSMLYNLRKGRVGKIDSILPQGTVNTIGAAPLAMHGYLQFGFNQEFTYTCTSGFGAREFGDQYFSVHGMHGNYLCGGHVYVRSSQKCVLFLLSF